MPPPQSTITQIGTIEGAQKILSQLNYDPDIALLNKCRFKSSVLIGDIYAEADKTLPTTHAGDPQLWEIADDCTAAFYKMYVASTPQDKSEAREEIDMCKKAVRLHIGISEEGGDTSEIPEPKTFLHAGLSDLT